MPGDGPSPSSSALEESEGNGLPEPGKRWGSGAQSVLPYLTKTLQAKPASSMDSRDATRPSARDGHNPVFSDWPPKPRA